MKMDSFNKPKEITPGYGKWVEQDIPHLVEYLKHTVEFIMSASQEALVSSTIKGSINQAFELIVELRQFGDRYDILDINPSFNLDALSESDASLVKDWAATMKNATVYLLTR